MKKIIAKLSPSIVMMIITYICLFESVEDPFKLMVWWFACLCACFGLTCFIVISMDDN
jgi:hypothetical protein